MQAGIRERYPSVPVLATAALAAWTARADTAQPVLLDVRTPAEYAVSHLAGARLAPVAPLDAGHGGAGSLGLMRRLALKLVVNAVAVWAASHLVPGVQLSSSPVDVALVALVFALVNTFLKPVALILSLPALVVSLGLFTFVVNAGLFALVAWLTPGLVIDGFGAALVGGLVVSIVSIALNLLLKD